VTRHPIVVLAAMTVVLVGLAAAAALRYLIPQIDLIEFNYANVVDESAINEYYEWVYSGSVYFEQVPWLILAALLTGVTALALAAHRAQRRLRDQAGSASLTASRETARS
jgi:hypothetical protein